MRRSTSTPPTRPARSGLARFAASSAALLAALVAGYLLGAAGHGGPCPQVSAEAAVAEPLPQTTIPALAAPPDDRVVRRGEPPALHHGGAREDAPPAPAYPDRPPETGPSPEIRARVEQDAAAELENLKPAILANCWNAATARLPSAATFTYSVIFDAEGQEIERGSRDASDVPAEVGECIRSQAGALLVRPPGREIEVTVALTLP